MNPAHSGAARSGAGSGDRRAELVAFLVAWLPYAWLVRRFWFVTDDSYISFRYARNLARGLGLRYNLGVEPPVEGYSNFLWTVIAAGFERAGADVAFWMPLLSFLCGTALLWTFLRVLRDRFGLGLPATFLATAALGCFPPFAVWSTGGLATMPFAWLLFVTFDRLVLRDEPDGVGGGIAALLVSLLRVEAFAWCLVVAAIALLVRLLQRRAVARPLVVYLAILGVGFGAYYAWRYSYYGLPVPNTAYAKVGFSAPVAARGWRYVVVYLATFLTPLLFVPGLFACLRRRWWIPALATAAMAFGFFLYPVVVGGDFMAMGRFLVPGLAFNGVLFGLLLEGLWGEAAPRRAAAGLLTAAVLTVGLLPAWNVHLVPKSFRERYHFRHNVKRHVSEWEQWKYMDDNCLRWRVKGQDMKRIAAPDATVVAGAIGNFGYYSELFIFDKAGLVNHEVALQEAKDPTRNSPGHDKGVLPRFFAKYDPDYLEVKIYWGTRMRRDVEKEAAKWRRNPLARRYAPEVHLFPATEADPGRALLLWKRVEDGADAEARWAEFDASLDGYDWPG